jgi:hypothetical protein
MVMTMMKIDVGASKIRLAAAVDAPLQILPPDPSRGEVLWVFDLYVSPTSNQKEHVKSI